VRRRSLTRKLTGAVLAGVPFVALAIVVYLMASGRGPQAETRLVVVEPGESLSQIGLRYGVTPEAIAALNCIDDPSRIYPNQVLIVPEGPEARVPASVKERAAALVHVPSDVRSRRWRYIVVHHSAGASGDAHSINDYHTHVRGWRNGLGYHFVIGNGSATPDGFIEAGPRWARQMDGAHAESPGNRMNREGIGICLVGNFEQGPASEAQMRALVQLVRALQRRHGIPRRRVIGHRDVKQGHTVCPGSHFSIEQLRKML